MDLLLQPPKETDTETRETAPRIGEDPELESVFGSSGARYGILFRELLHKELPQFRWSGIFRSLRVMELSGEILSGQFFKDIPGLQFILPAAFQKLQAGLPETSVDPAGQTLETDYH